MTLITQNPSGVENQDGSEVDTRKHEIEKSSMNIVAQNGAVAQPDTMGNPISLSIAIAKEGCGSTQKRLIGEGENVTKDPNHGQWISKGMVEVLEIAGLKGFEELISDLPDRSALILGIPDPNRKRTKFNLRTADAYKAITNPDEKARAIPRTKDHFGWPEGNHLLMLDIDREPNQPDRTPDELIALMVKIYPELADVGRLYNPSSSSHIYHSQTGKCLLGAGSHHIYIVVEGDVERWKSNYKDFAWAIGDAFFKLATPNEQTGVPSILERFPIDLAVLSPERLIYELTAILEGGIECRRPSPTRHDGGVWNLDATSSPTDQQCATANCARGKARKAIEKIRADSVIEFVRLESPTLDEKAIKAIAKTRVANCDSGILKADHILYREDGSTILAGELTADDVGLKLRDPQEPDYHGGALKAIVLYKHAKLSISSRAHGGRTYTIELPCKTSGGVPVVQKREHLGDKPEEAVAYKPEDKIAVALTKDTMQETFAAFEKEPLINRESETVKKKRRG